MLSAADKLVFWSGIMRDHAEFFLFSLSFRETDFIKTAQFFKDTFIRIGNEAETLQTSSAAKSVPALADKILPVLMNFIHFKQLAIRKLLQCEIELGLPPSFINHMVNEAMEFLRDLNEIRAGITLDPVEENIQLHIVWLPDASGHAAAIKAELDPTETMIINEAEDFKKTFDHLFIKAVELGQMLKRTGLKNSSLEWLNHVVHKSITEFIAFLEKVLILREQCKVMGTLDPLIPSHMIREENYYLYSLQSLTRHM